MADGDADKIVSILIKFGTLNPEAAQQAAAEILKVRAATQDAGRDLGNMGEDLGLAEKRFEGVSGQSRETYRIFSELDRVAPGLGEALRAVFVGPLAGVGALIFVLDLLVEKFEKIQEAAAKANLEIAKEQQAVWDDQLAGAQRMADLLATQADQWERINDAKRDSNNLERDRNELLQAQFEAQQKILKAQETAELAAAGDDEVKKAQIRQRYEDTRSQDELNEEAKKVAAAKNDADRAAFTNSQDQDALTKAQAAARAAEDPNSPDAVAADRAKANQAYLNAQNQPLLASIAGATGLTDFAAASKEIAKQLADAKATAKAVTDSGAPDEAVDFANKQVERLEALQQQVDQVNANNEAMQKNQAVIDAHTTAVSNAIKAQNKAAADAADAAKKAQETADAYATAIQILKINTAAANQAQQTQTAGTFAEAINAATSAPGTRLTAEQQAAIAIISDAFAKMHGNFILWIQSLVAAVQSGHMTLAQEQAEIQQVLAQLQAQMTNQK